MASYFEEHNCEELGPGEAPDGLLHLARFLAISGHFNEEQFASFFSDRPPPPASQKFIDGLENKTLNQIGSGSSKECPICLKKYDGSDIINVLPCDHSFHKICILKWLEKTSSCPMCRHELPTDDEAYEEMKKYKKREKQRQFDIENLHDSMFG